ncbi:MAG: methyltransferase domain-containing protein [Anaerolineae bacterium]|nr:methyltransferase domain-containing protein [Anaerolineae bacterium]
MPLTDVDVAGTSFVFQVPTQAMGSYVLFLGLGLCRSWEWLSLAWNERERAEVVLISRYLPQSLSVKSDTNEKQRNAYLRRLLDFEVHDLTGGMLLCRRDVLSGFAPTRQDALMWTELLVHAYAQGYRIAELPLPTTCRLVREKKRTTFSRRQFAATLWRLWLLRNSIQCADYDARAFNSRIPFQRAWQRARYAAVMRLIPPHARTLDIGCGSSKILASLPEASVGLDIQLNKLRFARRYGRALANGDTFRLPFAAQSFDCVLSSQVIEHLPADDSVFDEMVRVLRPEGRLIIGTPDYHSLWPVIERLYSFFAPNAYADEHITHYYPTLLRQKLRALGFRLEASTYVFGAEWVGMFRREPRVFGSSEES